MNGWISALFGLIGVTLGAALTYLREYVTQQKREKKDAAYLAVVVAGALDRFSAECVRVVADDGLSRGQRDESGFLSAQVKTPTFQPEPLGVDWKSVPADLMYPILDLPYRIEMANRKIHDTAEYQAEPPDYDEFFEDRQFEYAVLGLDASALATKLRRHIGFPDRPTSQWDPLAYMADVKSKIEEAREERARRHASGLGVPALS